MSAAASATATGVSLSFKAAIHLAIYTDNAGKPGPLLVDAGSVDATATGAKTLTIAQTLDAGMVWLQGVAQGSPAAGPSMGAAPSTGHSRFIGMAAVTSGNAQRFYATGVTGALPNPASGLADNNGVMAVMLKAV
jgi:hypothetical protein